MNRSSEFNKKVRGLAFARCKGKCEKCGANLKVGEGEYDHIIPLALTGESTLENCQVLCQPCHRAPGAKTADDVKNIAKAKRREAKHIGVTKPVGKLHGAPFAQSEKAAKRAAKPSLPFKPMFREVTP